MVKYETDWNSYVNNLEPYEPYELEEIYHELSAMEVFALKFDFGERKQGYISGKITIIDMYHGGHTLFSTPTYDDFLLINTGKFTQLSGGTELPINANAPVKIKLDLFDKYYGILDFGPNYGFSGVEVEEEEEEDEEEDEEEEDDDDDDDDDEEEDEEEEEEEDEEEKRRRAAGEELMHKPNIFDQCFLFPRVEMTADEVARAHQICRLWDDSIDYFFKYTEKLLRKKVTCPCFSLEVMYAVYEDAMAASVYVTFAEWNPSYFTGSSRGKRIISRRATSNGMHVYGQVTARNTLLTHPDATTTLFGKEIDELFHINLGDLIPMLKTFVVFPRKSSLLLDIDLRHVLPNAPLLGHKVPPSELFVKTTLEMTYQHCSYNRFVVQDWGPAKLFVDVTWHHLSDEGMFYHSY